METTGCGTALITPFRGDGSVDERALHALVNWQIDSGIDFLIACGSTGEAATLDEDEWLEAVRIVVEAAAGRVPVWAGCTHNATHVLLKKARKIAQIRGVDAVLSASPYYNKPTQEGQYQHFRALALELDPLPVVLYNVPGRTGVNLEATTVIRLANEFSNIAAVKESSGALQQTAALVNGAPAGFKVFCGDDYMALPAIEAGANGLASVASNEVPAEMALMVRAALRQEWSTAREIERKYTQLFEANFWETNPAPVKTILSMMGRCEATVRLPLVQPDRTMRQRLEQVAGELGLLRDVPQEGDMRVF